MKKKWFLFILIVLAAVLATGLAVFRFASGQRPFAHITADQIASARVEIMPPDKEVDLDREAIEDLAGILRVVTVYRKDDSYRDYSGQAAVYTISLTDGTVVTVQAYNPFLIIDGVGYRTKYEPCQALSALGNEQLEE